MLENCPYQCLVTPQVTACTVWQDHYSGDSLVIKDMQNVNSTITDMGMTKIVGNLGYWLINIKRDLSQDKKLWFNSSGLLVDMCLIEVKVCLIL